MADGGCSSGRRNSSFSTKICNKFYHTPTLYHQLNNKNRHTYNILYNNYNNIIKARSFSNNLRPYDDHELMYDAGSNADYSDSDDEEVELYVGNLSYYTDEHTLHEIFNEFGKCDVSLPMSTWHDTGRPKPRGYAFVKFSNRTEAENAIAKLDEIELDGRNIHVKESQSKFKSNAGKNSAGVDQVKLYVGNLPFDTTEKSIHEMFEQYGSVSNCFFSTRGFAFVTMPAEEARQACNGLNGMELDGRVLRVNESQVPRREDEIARLKFQSTAAFKNEDNTTTFNSQGSDEVKLYVGNVSFNTTEESIRELFGDIGDVYDCFLPVDRETGNPRGFAFVTMAAEDAKRACDDYDGMELDGRTLRVNKAQIPLYR